MSALRLPVSVVSVVVGALVAGVTVTPAEAGTYIAYTAPAYQGVVTVSNYSGASVTLYVEGQAPRALAANQTARVSVAAGQPRVRATYRQFGAEYTLQSTRVNVYPGRSSYLALSPDTQARLLVRNLYPQSATVMVNGRSMAALSGGESRVLTVPVGPVDLQLVDGGRTLQSTRMNLTPMTEPAWTVQPPPTGDLVVLNPLPIPVLVSADRGGAQQVAPGGRVELRAIPAGPYHVTVRRLTGEVIDDEVATIRGGQDNFLRVDPPTTGLVDVTSQHWIPVMVRLDGKLLTTILPNQESRVTVPLGWHDLQIVDVQAHVLVDRWVEVDPFEIETVRTGVPLPPRTGPVATVTGSHGRPDGDGYDDGCEHHDGHDDHHGYDDNRDGRYDRTDASWTEGDSGEDDGDVVGVAWPDGTYTSSTRPAGR